MDGRWTIRVERSNVFVDGAWLPDRPTPVVPCDDAAVERVAVRAWVKEMRHTDHANSERAARCRWDSTSEVVRDSWRNHARDLLAVAGDAS